MRARLKHCRYARMIRGFRQLQFVARGWLGRRHVAAVVIQSVVRTWSERRRLAHMRQSAVAIQVVILHSVLTESLYSIARNSNVVCCQCD